MRWPGLTVLPPGTHKRTKLEHGRPEAQENGCFAHSGVEGGMAAMSPLRPAYCTQQTGV